VIALSSADVIAASSADVIAASSADLIALSRQIKTASRRGSADPTAAQLRYARHGGDAMERIDMHKLQELVRLTRMGDGAREVARRLKMSPNTERRYRRALDKAGLLHGDPKQLPSLAELQKAIEAVLPVTIPEQWTSSVEQYEERIETMLDGGAMPKAIYDRLRLEDKEFSGSLSAIKRLCDRLKRQRGPQPEDVAIPVDTEPGQIAQVDFGYIGKLYDPAERRFRKAWVFVLVLGYSRHLFAKIAFDQKVETWIRLHMEAFAALGGVPAILVPDNLKAAVIRAAFGVDSETALNRSYRELARHYDFKIDPTPPCDPKKKGKVESSVKYVKGNFFRPRKDIEDATVLQAQLDDWTVQIAGQRDHGTTHRRPLSVFCEVEAKALLPLPNVPYEIVTWRECKVHQDTHIMLDRALYSVPWAWIGQSVLARATAHAVAIYANNERVATHPRGRPGQRLTIEEHLPPHRRELRHRSRSYWEERADKMGEAVGRYVREVFDSDDVLYQLRTVQKIVTYLEQHPRDRAQAACLRASFFGSYTYGRIKRILTKALDKQSLPGVELERAGLETPRFARDIQELFSLSMEANDAPN
jgi:transposase